MELIGVCREKLQKTDAEVRGLVAGLQDEGDEASTGGDGNDENLPF